MLISGRNEKLPGHPLVYSTSKNFMDYFGLNSEEDLPKIREVLAEQMVEPTYVEQQLPINEAPTEETPAENSGFTVGENGELIVNSNENNDEQASRTP